MKCCHTVPMAKFFYASAMGMFLVLFEKVDKRRSLGVSCDRVAPCVHLVRDVCKITCAVAVFTALVSDEMIFNS